jgi:hypothetical protein
MTDFHVLGLHSVVISHASLTTPDFDIVPFSPLYTYIPPVVIRDDYKQKHR